MNKDIQTILDKRRETGEAKVCGVKATKVTVLGDELWFYICGKASRFSFNDLLLDSNLFEVLGWKDFLWDGKITQVLLNKGGQTIEQRECHKAMCLLLPTQEERVKYILDNLTEKE